jgi:octaprenyl-diphosphate synthase
MHHDLRQIKILLKDDILQYERTLKKILLSPAILINQVVQYIVRFKGKNLRPLLVLLSARLAGKPGDITYTVAAIIELLHTATIIHDDVIDNSQVRRNFPTINAVWKNKVSVLIGDYLLAKSLITASELGNLKIIEILAETAKSMSRGELFQIEKSRKLNIVENEYYNLIADKTACLFTACCELGAFSVKANPESVDALKHFGFNLGMAFQIKDDLLDYQGRQKITGKPTGNDIKHKQITLPLIFAFQQSSNKEKMKIIRLIKQGENKKNRNAIIDFCREYRGIDAAHDKALEFSLKAKESIHHFADNQYKESAYSFVDYIISRNK